MALTWLLQVMPLFFLAGGYANLAAYTANAARNGSDAGFVRSRLRRLVIPCLPMIGAWAVVHVLTTHLGHATSVWHWGRIVFVALWFLAAYGTVTTLVPITARLHRRAPWTTLAGMVGGVAVLDLIRFTSEVVVVGGVVNSLAVFVVVQQLGYFWRDHACTVTARTSWLVVAAGVALLVVMTTVGPYPRRWSRPEAVSRTCSRPAPRSPRSACCSSDWHSRFGLRSCGWRSVGGSGR